MADPIQYQSALPQLLTQLLGQTQKTSGGTSTSSSSTQGTANTDPLMQIFGQQMGASTPEGMAALLGELFQTGAQQVPVLTDAYANSRGARSSNNSGLSLALAELNKGLTGQAATLLGKQRADTAQTAGAIANATRGTTTTGTQSTGGTKTTTGNPKAAAGLGLAGFGLNAADKLGLLKGVKGSVGSMFGGAPAGAATFAPVMDFNAGLPSYDSYDLQGTNLLTGSSGPGAFDIGMDAQMDWASAGDFGFGGMDFGGSDMGFDPSQYTDWSNGFANSGGVIDEAAMGYDYDAYDFQDVGGDTSWFDDLGSSFSNIGDSIGSFFGFKDGGLVKKESLFDRRRAAIDAAEEAAVKGDSANDAYQERLRKQAAEGKKAPGYADGGLVHMSSYSDAPFNHQIRLMPRMPVVRTVPTGMRYGYADGGMVRRPMRYADGGTVRNRNYMGGPLSRGMGSGAINRQGPERQQTANVSSMSNSGSSGGSLTSAQLMEDPILRERFLTELTNRQQRAMDNHLAAIERDNATRRPGENPGSPVTGGNPGPGGAAGALGSMGMGVASTLAGILAGPLGTMGVQAIGQALNAPSAMTPTSAAISGLKAAFNGLTGAGETSTANAAEANALAAASSMDPLDALMAVTGAFGTENGSGGISGPGEGSGLGPGASAGDASSGEGGTGGGSGDGTGGTSATAADGGKIKGKGTGISDSIPAKLSDGEFVFSADVVEMLGADLLQNIQNRLHTPAAVQKAAGAK